MATVGYCAVIVEAQKFFQGLKIDDGLAREAAAVTKAAGQAIEKFGPAVQLAAPSSSVFLLMDPAKRELIAYLESALVHYALHSNWELASATGLAIREQGGFGYFTVTATAEAKGFRTKLALLKARSPEEASAEVHGLEAVQRIKTALVPDALEIARLEKKDLN